MKELQIGCLIADTTLDETREDLEEKQQEYINETWDQEREEQISMSRGGL